MYVIETRNLGKTYDQAPVLHNLTLRVVEGEAYALLGPNGAGKSTLIHLLFGFLMPTHGTIRVLGTTNLQHVRGRLGYLPERLFYHMRFRARDYLMFLGRFSDMSGAMLRRRVDEELERVGLAEVATRRLSTFSKGMLQRLGLAQALLAHPHILLLDEPTSGLDPTEQRELIDLLSIVRAQGHTIFLCTHYIEQVEQVCDRVGVLARGRLADEITVHQLRTLGTNVKIHVDRLTPDISCQLMALSPGVQCLGIEHSPFRAHPRPSVTLNPNTPDLQHRVLQVLLDHRITVLSLEPLEHPLEQFYLQALSDTHEDTYGGAMPLPHMGTTTLPLPSTNLPTRTQHPTAEPYHGTPFIHTSHGNTPARTKTDPLLDELLFGEPDSSSDSSTPGSSSSSSAD